MATAGGRGGRSLDWLRVRLLQRRRGDADDSGSASGGSHAVEARDARRVSASTWKTRRRVHPSARAIDSTLCPAARMARIRIRRGGGLGTSTRSPPKLRASFSADSTPTAWAKASSGVGQCGMYSRVPPKRSMSLAVASSPINWMKKPNIASFPQEIEVCLRFSCSAAAAAGRTKSLHVRWTAKPLAAAEPEPERPPAGRH
jgi:hypothetical protein